MSDRDPRFDGEQRERVARLYREGMSEREVSERVGLSKSRVHQLLRSAGVRRRSRKSAMRRAHERRRRAETPPETP